MGFFNWFKKKEAKIEKDNYTNEIKQDELEQAQASEQACENSEQVEQDVTDILEQVEPEIVDALEQLEPEAVDISKQAEQEITDALEQPEPEMVDTSKQLEQDTENVSEQIDLSQQSELEQSADLESDKSFNSIEGDLIVENDSTAKAESATHEKSAKKGLFSKLLSGLDKTRKNILGSVDQVLKAFTKVDEELFEELEEALIIADIGIPTTEKIISSLRQRIKSERIADVKEVKKALVKVISEILERSHLETFELKSPSVVLIIGVNGVGKTTTIGKIANNFKKERKKVLIAAADTFRAAAIDQLEVWANRANIDIIKHQENSDPAAVVYDAILSAKAKKTDVLICDTAGRLHNKKNLMEELKKIFKIINRDFPEAQKEVFLVLDATTGQNALQQAKLFSEVADITGIVLTKLDGTAKGGIVISISNELKIPVRYIGVGEGINDLQPFVPIDFAKALFNLED